MKKLLALALCLIALSAQGQVKISDLPQVSPALGTDLLPMSNTSRSTSSSYVLSVATIGAYVLASPTVTGALTFPAGAVGAPSLALAGSGGTTGIFGDGSGKITVTDAGTAVAKFSASGVTVNPSVPFFWNSGVLSGGGPDTGLSRSAAGVIAVGTGAAGSTAGAIVLNAVTAGSLVVNNTVSGNNALTVSPNGGPGGVGTMVTIGSGSTTNMGIKIGYSQSGYGAIYGGEVTPSTSNYILRSQAGSGETKINAPGTLSFGIGDTSYMQMSGTGLISPWNINLGSVNNEFGGLFLTKTVTGVGTTGAQVINKPTGTVNFAAAATALVVTNSIAAVASIINATAATNDTTCSVKNVVAAAGSFTINMTAACTAETRVNWRITN